MLHEAIDDRTPLLERVNFLAIFTSNLDEFVMKRVYGLREQVRAGVERSERYQATSAERLATARRLMQEMQLEQAEVYCEVIRPALAREGIHLLEWADLTGPERDAARALFESRIFPVLTPLSVDVGHPFPFISNLSLSLGLLVRDPRSGEQWFARVKVPDSLRQWVRIETPAFEGEWRFVHLADLIREHAGLLFPGMEIDGTMPFRVTRNIDVDADADDVEDLLEAVEEQLRQRRMECAVRLEVLRSARPDLVRLLLEELDLGEDDVYEMPGPLEYVSLREISSLPVASLHYEPWTPIVPPRLRGGDRSIFDVIRAGDLLVQHPYDSFDESVLRFVREAVHDPAVQAIKMTLYRTGTDSPFIPLLITRGRVGEAGGLPGGAAGAPGRTAEHRAGAANGEGGRSRRVRHRRAQDPHQDDAGDPGRRARRAVLCAHRHRQLPSADLADLHGPGSPDLPAGPHDGPPAPVQLPHRPEPQARLRPAARGAREHEAALPGVDWRGGRARRAPAGRRGSSRR